LKTLISLSVVVIAAVAATLSSPCFAAVELDLDLRLVNSNGRQSFLEGGLGKLRFDANDNGVQVGRVRFGYRGSLGGDWHVNFDASMWSAGDVNPVDVTEAYLEWRPVPTTAWRSRVKVGAFYPAISLEHRARGWTNPYTLSSSALNTWIGEEFRTIGAQYSLDHLGTAEGKSFDYGMDAAMFGWNDPAGIVIALRGFSLNDRQTPLFGRLSTYAYGGREQRVIFSEIDHRPGYHVGGFIRHRSGIEVRALHYDNRGDPGAFSASIDDYAWATRFDTLGMRYDLDGLSLIVQGLRGTTDVGPNLHDRWKYQTAFVLASREFGRHRLAARMDTFNTRQLRTKFLGPLGDDSGHAITLAWTYSFSDNLDVVAEWLTVDSRYNKRAALGESPQASERSLQLALKWAL
jgi:hypothetical protein